MIVSILLLLFYLLMPVGLMYLHTRFSFCRSIGSIIMAYIIGILLSLSGLSSPEGEAAEYVSQMKDLLQNICVPMAISLMLFSSSFKQWIGRWKQIIMAFLTGIAGVSVAVLGAFLVFKSAGIPELEKAAGLMMGFYTGGTPNVASLKMALAPTNQTFLLVNSFEIMITFFLLAFLVGGGYKFIRKILPYKMENEGEKALSSSFRKNASMENYRFMYDRRIWRTWWLPLSMAVAIAAVSLVISIPFASDYRVVAVILSITTLSIIASFWGKLRKSPRTFELGMYFILVFSILIASDFSFGHLGKETAGLMMFIAVVLCCSVFLHFLFAKLCKIDADMFTISIAGLIFSPPFVPTVAGAMKNKSCVPGGILIGLLGYAVGNYLGVGMYVLCNSL